MAIVVANIHDELSLPDSNKWVEELLKKALPQAGGCVAYQKVYNGDIGSLIAASAAGLTLGVKGDSSALKLTTVAWKRVDTLDATPTGLIVGLKSGAHFELRSDAAAEQALLRDFYCKLAILAMAADGATV